MAKSKRRAHKYPTTKTGGGGSGEPDIVKSLETAPGLKDYVLLNILFAGFCLAQLVVVRLLMKQLPGVYFFFGFLIVAFMVVSVFDYFVSRLSAGTVAVADERALEGGTE